MRKVERQPLLTCSPIRYPEFYGIILAERDSIDFYGQTDTVVTLNHFNGSSRCFPHKTTPYVTVTGMSLISPLPVNSRSFVLPALTPLTVNDALEPKAVCVTVAIAGFSIYP